MTSACENAGHFDSQSLTTAATTTSTLLCANVTTSSNDYNDNSFDNDSTKNRQLNANYAYMSQGQS